MSQPSAPRNRKPARLTQAKAKLAAEIRDQLAAQGGAAHRDVVIGRILQRKNVHGPAAERTRRALLSAFELHVHPEPGSEAPRLFDLPFGPDSYRWALDEPGRPAIICWMASSATDRIRKTSVASVHIHYVAKVERKGRTRAEVDQVIRWLTGYSQEQLEALLAAKTDFETFFAEAPAMNPNRFLITGVICGYRVEEIEDPFMRELRHLDKLVDEVSKGKAMEKVLRAG